MHNKSLSELSNLLSSKQISSVELAKHYLTRLNKLNDDLNSFITITEERALQDAKHADELIANKKAQPLTGIPIAHKDIFCT